MIRTYKLNGRTPVLVEDILEWAKWFETANRRVNETTIGDVGVSTVFLGIDNSFHERQTLIFETMIFGGKHDEYQERYSTWEEAEHGHAKAVELVQTGDQ